MIKRIIEFDQNLFLVLNGAGSTNFDQIMLALSSHWIWVPAYILAVYFFTRKAGIKGLINLVILFITLFISDQTSVHLFKEVFQRLRPCHEPFILDQMRLVADHCGGKFGFVSSHATNSFALLIVSAGLIRNRSYLIIILIWAMLVSYSRIYVGVHYPGDILAGALLGIGLGVIILEIIKLTKKKILKYAKSQKA